MRKDITIGLVVPFATDEVPFEGPIMYPGVRFIPRGVGVRNLTPEGYEPAWNGILPAAEYLAAQNVDAIMVIGTSLTFYQGPQAHDRLLEQLRQRTGLPVSTMSQSIIDGLREVGAKRVAVATAYSDVVNRRLKELLRRPASRRWRWNASTFWIRRPEQKERSRHHRAERQRGRPCQGRRRHFDLLRRLAHARSRKTARRPPPHSGGVVGTAAFWAAMRLVGESGRIPGYGRLLEQATAPVH